MTTANISPKIIWKLFLFSLFTFSSASLVAQRPLATFKGTIKSSGVLLDSVKITVIDNTAIIAEGLTKKDGKFKFASFYNKTLLVEFEKPGYLKQIIRISTYIPPRLIAVDMSMVFVVEMLPLPANKSEIHFDKPIEEIILDTNQGKFVFNPEYQARIKEELDAIKKSVSE
jgi:hypothetical protein